jgi:glutathione S-transferase
MKLYMHPMSTTSRTVLLFLEDQGIKLDQQAVDLFSGEHHKPQFTAVNPSRMVPVLEDDGFRMTESSAILKYIADKANSPAYPKDLKKRARVNEIMDWFNSNFYRDYGYGVVYPQLFPGHKRPSDAVQAATLAWHKERSQNWLRILNDSILGMGARQKYLTGDDITIADYFASEILAVGEGTCLDCDKYPNVARWMKTMRSLPAWAKVNGPFEGWIASLKDKKFEAV